MTETFTFRRAELNDDGLISRWFHSPHVSQFWGEASKNIRDFRNAMTGVCALFNYWIGQDDTIPFCLLITTDATRDTPEHLAPFLPETGEACTLDVLIGPPEYVGRGIATQMLESFLSHIQYQNRALRTVLIDPEANNSRAIHVYEKAGFQLVSEFVPSDGAFQGKPHVLMAYHYYQTRHSRTSA
ncbi:MAG TPA: GNAT family N-acetyltransferase [Gammaproteobacteria bacterium]|nr:GNAT family N-acetyltransferase [Gammaproteobacteria bacterium]